MRFLITGLGSIGQRHLRNLRYILGDKADILAYRSIGQEIRINEDMTVQSGVDLENTYGIEIFNDYTKALEKQPDAVFITNPTKLHIETALMAAKYGCHLFIEKPLSDDLHQVDELKTIVKEKNLITLIGYQLRFHPCLEFIHKLITEQTIGQIIRVYSEFGEYLPGAHPYEDYREGYAARKKLGGGVLLCYSHEIDYLVWLFGLPRKLFATGGKISSLEVDVDDVVSVLMEYMIDGKPVPVTLHLDFVQRPPSRFCSIIGEKGRIFWDFYADRVDLNTTDRQEHNSFKLDNFNRNDVFLTEIKHFIACIEGKEKPAVDINEGMKSLQVALAAKRSLELGIAVKEI